MIRNCLVFKYAISMQLVLFTFAWQCTAEGQLSSLWIWKGVYATLQSDRYTFSYLRGRYKLGKQGLVNWPCGEMDILFDDNGPITRDSKI